MVALRKAAAVLALAGAMDQRAALERAAEAGRRRFVRGLVDEVRRTWYCFRRVSGSRAVGRLEELWLGCALP